MHHLLITHLQLASHLFHGRLLEKNELYSTSYTAFKVLF